MNKSTFVFGLLLAVCAPASAHFVFLVPDGPSKGKAVFSDGLKPDKEGVPVDKIANTKLWTVSAGKTVAAGNSNYLEAADKVFVLGTVTPAPTIVEGGNP